MSSARRGPGIRSGLTRWYIPASLAAFGGLALAGLLLLGPSTPRAEAADPPPATAGFQTTEQLVVNVNLPAAARGKRPALTVELVGPDDKVVQKVTPRLPSDEEETPLAIKFKTPKVSADKLTVRCTYGKKTISTPLSKILLAKAHETVLSASPDLFAGSQAAMRCMVQGVKSLSQTVPLENASVEVTLLAGDKTLSLYKGKTSKTGTAPVEFKVPSLPDGTYKMEVKTKSSLGEETLKRDVKIQSTPRVLLTTDKPLYQPGQTINVRALALRSFDLTPIQKSTLTVEIEDGKGNKVFKKDLKTSEFGIAHTDFTLADEVNMGAYRIRAILGQTTADKTVEVKRYVLPKFKAQLTADKSFYMPKEKIKGKLQVDYFFGKPVAGGTVEVTASTFDVAFKKFTTWKGKTDKNGLASFEVKLPDYFVGTPLANGNAIVKLEVKVTDTADHSETVTRTYPVSDKTIRVSLIPEAGRIVPGVENKVFAAALYPDGTPAKCDVEIWQGMKREGKPLATLKTADNGLAELKITPKAEQFRNGGWQARTIEMLGGSQQQWGPINVFDLAVRAKDAQGNKAESVATLNADLMGENLMLILDKAMYKGGDALEADIRTTAGMKTVYLDVIKNGQVMLTRWLDVTKGKASAKVTLPSTAFGTLEVHAYQVLQSGEIIRDSRVVYAAPATDLKIAVKADKTVYKPGESGTIRFEVTDSGGNPTPAALGVLVVDEAVYALQDMQPGLEKVFFTLQEELMKPTAQILYKPAEKIDDMVRLPQVNAKQQQAARVLLTAVKPRLPARWEVNPNHDRNTKMRQQVAQVAAGMYNTALHSAKMAVIKDKKSGKWVFNPDLLDIAVKEKRLTKAQVTDPLGSTISLDWLTGMDKGINPDRLADQVTRHRLSILMREVANYAETKRATWYKNNAWYYPKTVLADAAKARKISDVYLKDGWGNALVLVHNDKKVNNTGWYYLNKHDILSPGPDGKVGTKDDIHFNWINDWWMQHSWWGGSGAASPDPKLAHLAWRLRDQNMQNRFGMPMGGGMAKGGRGGPFPGAMPPGAAKDGGGRPPKQAQGALEKAKEAKTEGAGSGGGGGAEPIRLREYFPETLLWKPALITDEKGRAKLTIPFADSITTWRLTASASSQMGLLGGVSAPLRVFQDFFVDLDLPVALTQNDEVAFPVAVYNYLKTPQTVVLTLKKEPWFTLLDGDYKRTLSLKAGEVTAIKFRIKAKKVGNLPLTVEARGSKMSDAIKRVIEVVPDGTKVEKTHSDRLKGTVKHTITIPKDSIPDASRLMVKVYPGVLSQVLDGAEGMIRLPGG